MKTKLLILILLLSYGCAPHYFETDSFKVITYNSKSYRYVDNIWPYYFYEIYTKDNKSKKVTINSLTGSIIE